jgi:hypothetical protein
MVDGSGEALLAVTGRNPGPDPAILAVRVNGRLASHAVLPAAVDIPVAVSLGRLPPGRHEVKVGSAWGPAAVTSDPAVTLAPPGDPLGVVLRHAPVLFGRTLPHLGGPLQNTSTDVPLLAWHRELAGGGGRVLEYSVLWSHEDGGTDGATLMARWGRTTDIEWVYRVAVDPRGDRIPGTAAYQGPGHAEVPFRGAFEDDHPLLQVATANNMMTDRVDGRLRFALAADATLPSGRAREVSMELHPWTFGVSAAEVEAAGLVDRRGGARWPALGDPRHYLYLEVPTFRDPPGRARSGLALGVRLAAGPEVFRSDHGRFDRAVVRDGPVATAIKLPPGTAIADVEAVLAFRVPLPGASDRIEVDGVTRGFLLDPCCRPGPSLIRGGRAATLTASRPWAVVWEPSVHLAAVGARCRRASRPGGPGGRTRDAP